MTRFSRSVVIFTVIATLLSGCSRTNLTSSWKDPEFRGPVRKVYLVGLAREEPNRRLFEETFNRELAALGVTGIASYRDFPPGEAGSQEAITARLEQNGADSILMARMTNLRIDEVISTAYVTTNSTWGKYYESPFFDAYTPPMTTDFRIATIEANLYEAKTGTLIWSALLETVVEGDAEKVFGEFVKTVTRDLQERQLL